MSWKSPAEPLARREVEIRLQRYKEFLDYARKKQNYSTAYGLLSTSGPITRFIAEVMVRRNFSNNQILEQRASSILQQRAEPYYQLGSP